MRRRERRRHARGDAEREGDERVGIHGDGAEGGEGRTVELALMRTGIGVSVGVREGGGDGGVHEGGHDCYGLGGVAQDGAELVPEGRVSR